MDIDTLKKLAGINEFQGYTEYKIDENPSITATALKQKERDMGIKLDIRKTGTGELKEVQRTHRTK